MAHYVVHIRSPLSADAAFTYMADMRNFSEWDPGVERVEQVRGRGAEPGAAFDLDVKGVVGSLTLRYEISEFEAPNRFVATARSSTLTSVDAVTVRADGAGSVVIYDADLTLNGPLRLADPLLRVAFDRIAGRAADGLIRVLDGERVPASSP
jgi:carbon monoxide dehydrogenase subunit G